jgi:hypothetical protein
MRVRPLRAVGILAAVPVTWAAAAGAAYSARAALARRRGLPMFRDVPIPAPTFGLAAGVALDELVLIPMRVLASIAPRRDRDRSAVELEEAVRFYETTGWLDEPASYFSTPPALDDVDRRVTRHRRGVVETLRFSSGFEPHPGEPGSQRWRSFGANRDVFARVLRHDGEPRPWLVAVHGQGMGRISDIDFLRVRRLHETLGVNVVLPVLPLHGPRREGMRLEQQFVSNVYLVNNVLGLAQAVWDLRRLLTWLRDHERAPSVGVYGFSLGSYVASLLSTLDGDLACVIAVVPAGDLAEAMRIGRAPFGSKPPTDGVLHDERSARVHRVVSPLAAPCRVPKERRFIVAGLGDRFARPPGAVLLWRHWEKPPIRWQQSGHTTMARSDGYEAHLAAMLRASGLTV